MKNKTKEDIKQICTYFSEDFKNLGVGTMGYSLTEEQFKRLFDYLEKNFVEKSKTKEVKADWEKEFDDSFTIVLPTGDTSITAGYSYDPKKGIKRSFNLNLNPDKVKDFIKKNFVSKGEVKDILEDFVETLKFNCEHNFHDENVVFGGSIDLELMKYLKLKSLE